MRRVAKNFYMASWIASYSLILILTTAGWVASWGKKGWELWIAFNIIPVVALIYLGIVFLILIYKLWASIEDNLTSISPGKAVGLMFIPFFNVYWIFRAVGGFAGEFNSYVKRHSINIQPLSEGLFLAFSIYAVTAGVLLTVAQVIEGNLAFRPLLTGGLSVISAVISLLIGSFLIAEACQGVNNMAGARRKTHYNIPAPQEQEVVCPHCQARLPASARFCNMCGTDQEAVKPAVQQVFCPKCQTELSLTARFCFRCGASLEVKKGDAV